MKLLLSAALALLPQWVLAQQLLGVTTPNSRVNVGEPVQLVLDFKATGLIWCGLRVDFGDGESREIRVERSPLTLTKQYRAAGRYDFRAKGEFLPRGLKSAVPCMGDAQSVSVMVADQAADAARQAAESMPLPPVNAKRRRMNSKCRDGNKPPKRRPRRPRSNRCGLPRRRAPIGMVRRPRPHPVLRRRAHPTRRSKTTP